MKHVNIEKLIQLKVQTDISLLDALMDVLGAEAPRLLLEISNAVTSGDLKAAAASCHSLKSSLGGLGCDQMAANCADMERIALTGHGSALPEMMRQLNNDWLLAFEELKTAILQIKSSGG